MTYAQGRSGSAVPVEVAALPSVGEETAGAMSGNTLSQPRQCQNVTNVRSLWVFPHGSHAAA
jgi:hypothetical protein